MAKKYLFSGVPEDQLKKRKKITQPTFMDPMLATLTTNYFSSDDWIYEHKYDGERCLAFKKNGKVTLKSRNDRVTNNEYPDLVSALEKQSGDNFVLDGEIIALGEYGVSDFQLLQGRMNLQNQAAVTKQIKTTPIYYRIFDCMYADGYDIRKLAILSRKKILKNLLTFKGTITYSEHTVGNGVELFKKACKLHWEGLIAKRAASPYVGYRSKDWLKFKCASGQELIIIGYTEPQGSRTDFGALLVGYYKGKKLYYAGKVGTGFTQAVLAMLGKKLRKLKTKKLELENFDGSTRGITWVKPQLVAEFKFANWTKGNKLRVPRYKGLRDDKAAKDVVKET